MAIDAIKIIPKIKELAEKHKLDLVVLFGSQASGRTHKQSDVDIAIMPKKRLRPIELARLQLDFSQNLKIKDLELADLKEATPLLLRQIADKSVLLYEKEPSDFENFKIYAYKRYMENKKLFELRDLRLKKFVEQKI